MKRFKEISMLYGRDGMRLLVPDSAIVLEGKDVRAVNAPQKAIEDALLNPIGTEPLYKLLEIRKPKTVAITISDITRPVPNKVFLPLLLKALNKSGIPDSKIVIIIGTGMHRPSSNDEKIQLVGNNILKRIKVIDHHADVPNSLIKISNNPSVSVCRHFVNADFRIVTGYIEPHFMAGFSGGRKGVCPALVDLHTVQRFHGYKTLADPRADAGILENNPCHHIALEVAKTVGIDFLFNVAITRNRQIAGIYCGNAELAHQAGCKQVTEWTTAYSDRTFDFVITNGGGAPLDHTFYQTVKGMCMALPVLGRHSVLLQVSQCKEGLGSTKYSEMMLAYNNDWQRFLSDIAAHSEKTQLDQWEYQMQTRVLNKIGINNLWFISDGIPLDIQKRISVRPLSGPDCAKERTQTAINKYCTANPDAHIAIIPDGPYTMIRKSKKIATS